MDNSLKLFPDIPSSVGMENALRRARQLADICWTPVRPVPATIADKVENQRRYQNFFLPAWRPQTGVNYSAARFEEKYVGFNVSLETYMTAISNPNSVMYTRSLHGRGPLCSAFYGTVCSEFVSYVMDMPFHIDCQQWPFLDGIEQINPEPLEKLRLCDIILERTRHIAVITGINRDADGKIVNISVAESTLPNIQTKTFTPSSFVEYWLKDHYEIFRYHKLDKISYTPIAWVPLEDDPQLERPTPNDALMPDYGNKANYFIGDEVTISVFDNQYTVLKIHFEGEPAQDLPLYDGKAVFLPDKAGFYKVVALNESVESEAVEFCVVNAEAITDKRHYTKNEEVRVSFCCAADDKLLGWVVKTAEFAKYWGYLAAENGEIPEAAVLPQGSYLIIALYRNKYGVYSSKPCPFEVE